MNELEEAARKAIKIIDNEDRHPQTEAEIRVLSLLVLALDDYETQKQKYKQQIRKTIESDE